MFFPRGQAFNVIIKSDGDQYLMNEPLILLPRQHEWLFHQDKWLYVKSVQHYQVKGKKPIVYLICESFDVPMSDIS